MIQRIILGNFPPSLSFLSHLGIDMKIIIMVTDFCMKSCYHGYRLLCELVLSWLQGFVITCYLVTGLCVSSRYLGYMFLSSIALVTSLCVSSCYHGYRVLSSLVGLVRGLCGSSCYRGYRVVISCYLGFLGLLSETVHDSVVTERSS